MTNAHPARPQNRQQGAKDARQANNDPSEVK